MNFGQLCDEFECISSPSVEATARQLARDILELREGNRALGTYAVSVNYKDPVRSFTGREKYKRPLWITDALDAPTVKVQEMVMLSTSVLSIKWTIKGTPKSLLAGIGGDLIVKVTSQFTLNQISGQVIEHEEFWDLSASSAIAQAYFWTSRRLFATIEAGKDVADFVKNITSRSSTQKENLEIYPDPSGDPTKLKQNVPLSQLVAFKKEKREVVEEEEGEVSYQLPWDVMLLFVYMNLETKPVITSYLCCTNYKMFSYGFSITLVLVVIGFITVSIIVSPNARAFSQNLVLVKETIDSSVTTIRTTLNELQFGSHDPKCGWFAIRNVII
ncbi:uncharacterized protein LOC130760157 isoform X2 [Actinidia eriantha]|nr:uncharacterized protein LOC130760157 isoform X2 [Actinidia eriantha]